MFFVNIPVKGDAQQEGNGDERDNRKRVAAGTIAGNPARKKYRGQFKIYFIDLEIKVVN